MSGYAGGLLTAGNNNVIEKRLWDAADDLRANSKLKSYEYSLPVLGLIFLKHADYIFTKAAKEIEGQGTGRRTPGNKTSRHKVPSICLRMPDKPILRSVPC